MADEEDSGVDKQQILAEIGASAPLPGEAAKPAPVPSAPPPRAPAAARDLPDVPINAMAPPALPAALEPPPPVLRSRQGRFVRHRRQAAGIVLVFVGVLWCGVALATEERMPFAIGGAFLGLAILIGAGSLIQEG